MGNIFGRPPAPRPAPWPLQPPELYNPPPELYNYHAYDYAPMPRPAATATRREPCPYFSSHGVCLQGDACGFAHDTAAAAPDAEKRRPCIFFARGHCKKGRACNFSHDLSRSAETREAADDGAAAETCTRELGGAWVEFGAGAAVAKISLPGDFSAVRISILPADSTAASVARLLAGVGVQVHTSRVRMVGAPAADKGPYKGPSQGHTTAIIKVEEASFAKTVCARLGTAQGDSSSSSSVTATAIPVPLPEGSNFHHVDCRQVSCSWYRPTTEAALSFGHPDAAVRVQRKFRDGKYRVQGRKVRARVVPGPATVQLQNLPEHTTALHITQSITAPADTPIRMTVAQAYEPDMVMDATLIKSMLTAIGPLERWHAPDTPPTSGKRFRVQATFGDETQAAAAAAALHNQPLPFYAAGKLFAQVVTCVRFKVSSRVYGVVQEQIHACKADWQRQFVRFFVNNNNNNNNNNNQKRRQGYLVLRLEGEDRPRVLAARQTLEGIVHGQVMRTPDGRTLWYARLAVGRATYRQMQAIEARLGVVIVRDVRLSQFRVFGPVEQHVPAAEALHQLMQEVAQAAQAAARAAAPVAALPPTTTATATGCPLCFDDWDDETVQMACGHVCCAGCFMNMCQSTAGAIVCPVDGCRRRRHHDRGGAEDGPALVGLPVIQQSLLSETFEDVLSTAFVAHVRRHPEAFRFCPTPDCDQIYRTTTTTTTATTAAATTTTFTCAKCFASLCTTCHVAHPGVRCAERGGATARHTRDQADRARLGIKDCPRCGTGIQKSTGCNHMQCLVCRAHLCWQCLALFDEADPCYAHMRRAHGSIGT